MARLAFFLLLLAILGFGAHLWLSGPQERTDYTARRTVDLSSQHGDVTVSYAPR